jgi:hypothetical protein
VVRETSNVKRETQGFVAQFGAILRFAAGLDRSHTNAVQDLRCALDGNRLIVTLLPGHGDEAERWAGAKKARWFEAVFGVTVVLISYGSSATMACGPILRNTHTSPS